jgi:magnesium and cobalt exporter, CNNM family
MGGLVGILIILLLLSAFFSVSETSMMAANRYRLRHRAKQGQRGARLAESLLKHTDRFLGMVLLGNNLLNAAAAALVTVITFRLFGENEFALSAATVTVTFLILVFSEVTPKVVGATHPDRIAVAASFILSPLIKLTRPIVGFVNLFVRGMLWLLRVKPRTEEYGTVLGMEELRTLVIESGALLPSGRRRILLNILELENITVDDVMRPRKKIEAVDINTQAEEILRQLATSHHTRLPVYDGTMNNVVGLLHVRRVLFYAKSEDFSRETLREILSEPYFVPAGTPLFAQLRQFQDTRQRLGLVVDEYGELMGLITLEDILEQIVGEFTSRAPTQSSPYLEHQDGGWLVDGDSLLRDLNRKLGIQLPLTGPKTLNGLILEHLENIPEPGTSLKIGNYPIEILQTLEKAVRTVRIFPSALENEDKGFTNH